ncbi:hypothetical protein JTB14_029006 [Gonioctena quinquepunctata]|nr:hypothetical protein JTB14_029006 [Gonioctena quinquepunctata]
MDVCVVYKNSYVAIAREVEVGDVILKVNETEVIRFSTKEVLRCLRLSTDPVTLKIKRDPNIKATVRKHLSVPGGGGGGGDIGDKTTKIPAVHSSNINSVTNRPEPAIHKVNHHASRLLGAAATNGSYATESEREPLLGNRHQEVVPPLEENERLQWQPLAGNEKSKGQPKFEAYMMTGEHILNISRMPPTTAIVPKQQKKMDNLRYHNSHAHHLRHQQHNSVPNSPNEADLGHKAGGRSGPNSATTSPISANKRDQHQHLPADPYNYVRTSRSEDQLQGQNDLCSVSVANSEADEDVTSSLNTLLDTRPDSAGCNSDSDRIVWTYNAPISDHQKFAHTLSNGSSSSHSNVSPTSSSPVHSGSPASPTSVSSSVMSSQSGSRRMPFSLTNGPTGQPVGEYSMSEAVSNISSPDYHDDDSVGIRDCVMEISDYSDSDSTLLVSEPRQRHVRVHGNSTTTGNSENSDHRIVIQVKGPEKDRARQSDSTSTLRSDTYGYQLSGDVPLELEHEEDGFREGANRSSPLSSEDESDVESLHSFHYSPKAVDMPSAIRLAKRLYGLEGFKKSDISRHLSKNNDFSRAVAEEYLKYFNFEKDTLDIALRKFLKQFSLTGETQERERVLVHFSKRYLDCNQGSFNSQDAVHTLTCAIMLLNTDLHGQNIGRKMTCNEFIENLAGLNECENFPRDVLKQLYHAIKNYPLEWALDEDTEESNAQSQVKNEMLSLGGNPFLDVPISSNAVEYKKGYVMRKCCYEANAKRSLCCIFLAPFHKRSWKMFYCTLRDLVLYLHKDENGFKKNQMGDNLHNAIRIHHALATKASDYTKKQFVFRLQTADQAEYLFQTSDSKELQSWIDTINFVCASFSAPPLEAAVGSQKKFQRPLLPCSHTKLNLREQLADHEERVMRLGAMLDDHRRSPPEKGSKSQVVQNYKEKETYLNFELKRYKTYALMLRSKMTHYPEVTVSLVENSIGEVDEATGGVTLMDDAGGIVPPPIPDRPSPTVNRKGAE